MSALIWDSTNSAWKEAETPMVYDAIGGWTDTVGKVWDSTEGAWKDAWGGAWIGSNGELIPTMTSNTEPFGVASASSYSNNSHAYYAFNETTNPWQCQDSKSDDWLEYELKSQSTARKLVLDCSIIESGSIGHSKTAKLICRASNDGNTWIDVSSAQNLSNSSSSAIFTHIDIDISVSVPYRKYRIYVYNKSSSVNFRTGLKNVQLYK